MFGNKNLNVLINFIDYNSTDDVIRVEGSLESEKVRDPELVFLLDDQKVDIKKSELKSGANSFIFEIPAAHRPKLRLIAKVNGRSVGIKTKRFTGLPMLIFSYRRMQDRTLLYYFGCIYIVKSSGAATFLYECLMLVSMVFDLHIKQSSRLFSEAKGFTGKSRRLIVGVGKALESLLSLPAAFIIRIIYFIKLNTKEKPIWLISDRPNAAGDNGQALFEYLLKNNDSAADVYFLISRKAKEYKKLKSKGSVIPFGGIKHKVYFLLADKIISSHADTETTNPFGRQVNKYLNLFNFDFVFLQHGVIRHDLSSWLNRFEKNIALFIASSSKEKKLILSHPYFYRNEQIAVTGLPRHDKLKSQSKRKIIIAPTYRNFLVNTRANKYGERSYDVNFKNSEYFNFYNSFINNRELIEALESHNATAEFYLHPVFKQQAKDFDSNKTCAIMPYPYDYKKAVSEGAMLISDHSSLVFDFAYLKKPVLYAHFDADKFYNGHSFAKPQSFDEERDGFGQVCQDADSLLRATTKLIKDDFAISEEYTKRAQEYFDFHDSKNSERVYKAILNLDKGKK